MTFPSAVSLFMVSPQVGVELAFCCRLLWALCLGFVFLVFWVFFDETVFSRYSASVWAMLVLHGLSLGPPLSVKSVWAVLAGAMFLEGRLHVVASAKYCMKPVDCPWGWEGSREEVSAQVSADAGLEVQVGALDMLGCQGAVWILCRQTGPFPRHPQLMKGKLFAVTWNGLSRQNMNVWIKR